jgi:hypothetical protein
MSEWLDKAAIKSVRVIDRRGFMRRGARGVTYLAAALASGKVLNIFDQTAAYATSGICSGQATSLEGCPGAYFGYPCGPSRCCSPPRKGTPSNCNCAASGSSCKNDGNYCFGLDTRHYDQNWPTPGCWTCTGNCVRCSTNPPYMCHQVTTCCDCKTNRSACNDPNIDGTNRGRCISWDSHEGARC